MFRTVPPTRVGVEVVNTRRRKAMDLVVNISAWIKDVGIFSKASLSKQVGRFDTYTGSTARSSVAKRLFLLFQFSI